ncbi:MAG: TraR/DksA C4-type zinc finger protein [bacterium]
MARQRGTSKPEKKTKVKRSGAGRTGAAARKKSARPKKTVTRRKKTAAKPARKAAAGVRRKAAGAKKTARKAAKKVQKTAAKKVVKVRKEMSKAARERMERLRTMLEERRTDILASIRKAREDSVEAHRRTFSEVGDLVSASLEKEMAFKYGEYGVNMLREIDSALEKLKEGSYGVCEECGKMIGVKRLEVVPFARLCIKCKSKEEEGTTGNR